MIELKTFAQFANIELTDFNPKPTTKTPGQLEASEILWESDDCTTKIGIWECSEGTFTADRTSAAEFCHILSGKASITTMMEMVNVYWLEEIYLYFQKAGRGNGQYTRK